MAIHEVKQVRVAEFKATGERYLLNCLNGSKALLWGEVASFKVGKSGALRSVHREGRWVNSEDITFSSQDKTRALLLSLLNQAARREDCAVEVTAQGAVLSKDWVRVQEGSFRVQCSIGGCRALSTRRLEKTLRLCARHENEARELLSPESRQSVMAQFTKVD